LSLFNKHDGHVLVLSEAPQPFLDVLNALRGKPGRWLVEQQDLRIGREGHRQGQFVPLTSRQQTSSHLAVGVVLQSGSEVGIAWLDMVEEK
jgi:hypothetical protein